MVQSLIDDQELCARLRHTARKFRCIEDIVRFCYQPARTHFETEKRTDNKIINVLGMRMLLGEAVELAEIVNQSKTDSLKSLFDVNTLVKYFNYKNLITIMAFVSDKRVLLMRKNQREFVGRSIMCSRPTHSRDSTSRFSRTIDVLL